MNLAEIRKKAGAVKKDDAATTLHSDVPETLEMPEVSAHLESSVPIESYSEPTAELEPFFEELTTEEEISEVASVFEVPTEESVSAEDVVEVDSEPAQQEVPALAADSFSKPDRAGTRQETDSNASSGKTSLIEAIVAGRVASSDSDDILTTQAGDSSTEIEEYLCFKVADEEYAISIMSIKEIIKPRDVTEVPRVPLFIQGVISLRGLIIPVMDMRCRLSLPVGSGTGRERIVVVRKDAGFCGILVDEVVQVARVAKKDIEDPPAILDGIDKAFVKGLGHYDGRMIILLDLETILDTGVH